MTADRETQHSHPHLTGAALNVLVLSVALAFAIFTAAPVLFAAGTGRFAPGILLPLAGFGLVIAGALSILTIMNAGVPGLVLAAYVLAGTLGALALSALRRRPLRWGLAIALIAAVGLHPLAISMKILRIEAAARHRHAIWSELQKSPSLPAQLGALRLAIPFAPIFEPVFRCDIPGHEGGEDGGGPDCGWVNLGRPDSQPPPILPGGVAQIDDLLIEAFGPGCIAHPAAPACRSRDRLAHWCAARPDAAATIWCTGSLSLAASLRPAGGFAHAHANPDTIPARLPALAPDHSGRPVQILCSAKRDAIIARKPLRGLMRSCMILYQPHTGIEAQIIVDHQPDSTIPGVLAAARADLERVLAALIAAP